MEKEQHLVKQSEQQSSNILKLQDWDQQDRNTKNVKINDDVDKQTEHTDNLDQQTNNSEIKKKKKKKMSNIRIYTEKCRSETQLVRKLIEEHGWQENQGNKEIKKSDIAFIGVERSESHYDMAECCKVNRIPGLTQISHKNTMHQILDYNRKMDNASEMDVLPKSYFWPEDKDVIEKGLKKKKVFIAKPDSGAQGEGIILLCEQKDLDKLCNNMMLAKKCYMVQEYVSKPLLINNKKQDFRLYVLVSSVFPLIYFINDEGLARFCTEDYETPTQKNIRNHFMHLTNYSLNKMSDKYVHNEETEDIHDGSKMTLASFWKLFHSHGYSQSQKQEVWDSTKELIKTLMDQIYPFIKQAFRTQFQTSDVSKLQKKNVCFHILGIDILLDKDLKPWLLEINANPSLNVEYEKISMDNQNKKNLNVFSPIDYYVKKRAVGDAILIVNKSIAKQKELDRFGTYSIIDVNEESNIIDDVSQIFEKLNGSVIYKSAITSSKFRKLAKLDRLLNDKVSANSFEIIFQQVMRDSDSLDSRSMDFCTFIDALLYLFNKLQSKFGSIGQMVDYIKTHL